MSVSVSTLGPKFSGRAIGVRFNDIQLVRSQVLQVGGSNIVNTNFALVFISLRPGSAQEVTDGAFPNLPIINTDNPRGIQIQRRDFGGTDGSVFLENILDSSNGNRISLPTATENERQNILYTIARTGSTQTTGRYHLRSSTQNINQNVLTTSTPPNTQELELMCSGWSIGGRVGSSLSRNIDITLYRFVVFQFDTAAEMPDVSQLSVQENFYNSTTMQTVNEQIAVSAYGTPALDIYGSASQFSAGNVDRSGNGNNFTVLGTGSFTDVSD
jgi:hypothetical protein